MKKIIFLSLVSFVVFVLINAPASLILPYINKSQHFQVQNISGNIFSAQMQTTGEIEQLSYAINPWELLLANLSFKTKIVQGDSVIHSDIKIDLITQKLKIKHLTGKINLALLKQYIPELSTVEPLGYLSFNNVGAAWNDIENNKIPYKISGNIELLGFNILEQDFGDYQLLIKTQSPNIIGMLSGKKSAKTNTKIKLELLNKQKQFIISGTVIGRDKNVSAILKQLNIGNVQHTIGY